MIDPKKVLDRTEAILYFEGEATLRSRQIRALAQAMAEAVNEELKSLEAKSLPPR